MLVGIELQYSFTMCQLQCLLSAHHEVERPLACHLQLQQDVVTPHSTLGQPQPVHMSGQYGCKDRL